MFIINCTPAMADVLSGAMPRPRERRPREKVTTWLRASLHAWRHCEEYGEIEGATVPDEAAAELRRATGDATNAVVTFRRAYIGLNGDATRIAVIERSSE